jgi:hypothetical protein
MFEHLVEIIRDQGQGVRAWETCAREAADAVADNPDLAAPYFLLGAAAGRLVETYFGEPLSSDRAKTLLTRFEAHATHLGQVFSTDDDVAKLKTLNAVASDLLNFGR